MILYSATFIVNTNIVKKHSDYDKQIYRLRIEVITKQILANLDREYLKS